MALFWSPCKSPIPKIQSPRNFSFTNSENLIITIPISSKLRNSIHTVPNFLNPICVKPQCSISSTADSSIEPDESSSKIIFVKGLPKSTSEGNLNKAFSEFGEVSRVKIVSDKRTRKSLGFAYVWFTSEEHAQIAVKEMNGKFFEGKFILVTIAKPGSCKPQEETTTTPLKF